MRKLILAATSVAVLAAPAVSMAAHSTVVPSKTVTPYTAQYTDSYGPAADQFNIVGTHIVKVAKTRVQQLRGGQVHGQDHGSGHGQARPGVRQLRRSDDQLACRLGL